MIKWEAGREEVDGQQGVRRQGNATLGAGMGEEDTHSAKVPLLLFG